MSYLKKRVQEKYGTDDCIVCLLFVDPLNDNSIPSYTYREFDRRTTENIEFFCPEFSTNQDRIFNIDAFADFVSKFEEITTWHYYGGTNMLLLRYHNGEILYDKVYDLNFTRLIIDFKIKNYGYFIEEFLLEFKNIERHLDKEYSVTTQVENIWENLNKILPNFVRKIDKHFKNNSKINSYFMPKNIKKSSHLNKKSVKKKIIL